VPLQALDSIQAPRRVLLTGTPFQNRGAELWNLLYFAHRERMLQAMSAEGTRNPALTLTLTLTLIQRLGRGLKRVGLGGKGGGWGREEDEEEEGGWGRGW